MIRPVIEQIEPGKRVSIIEKYESLPSTNTFARQRIQDGSAPGTVIWARRQTAGRGRRARTWLSNNDSLTFSVIWRFSSPDSLGSLSLAAGLWTVKALRGLGVRAHVKWPNDIWVGTKKLAGLLGESLYRGGWWWVIMGAGINGNGSSPLPGQAVTLEECLGHQSDIRQVLLAVLEAWDEGLDSHLESPLDFDSEFRHFGNFLGKTVWIIGDSQRFCGKAVYLKASGALVVETTSGLREVVSDDVSLRQECLAEEGEAR